MSEPTPTPPPTWAGEEDVFDTLGKVGPKVKAATEAGRFDTAAQLAAAHVEAYTRLEGVYGVGRVPAPVADSVGHEVLRWAVARLAAANILDILRASLPDVSELPERLRRTAYATLDSPVPGFPPGGNPGTPAAWGAPFSTAGGVSQFPDPYTSLPLYGWGPRGGATNAPGWLP